MAEISNFDKDTFKDKIMALTADIEVKNKALSVYDQLIQEGMEKGRYERIEKTILNSYALNLPIETIAKIAEVSKEKVQDILKKNNKI